MQYENRVSLKQGDLLDALEDRRFHLIVSNPPYVREDQLNALMPEVREYEPAEALYKGTGSDGSEYHRRLLSEAGRYLLSGGWLAMEVGISQARTVAQSAASYGYKEVEIRNDLSGIQRVVAVRI